MKRIMLGAFAVSAALCGYGYEYTLIPYSSAMTATGTSQYEAARGFVHAIDGSGLSTQNGVLVHTTSYSGTMWMSKSLPSESNPVFYCVDLGETYWLGAIKVWNYNQNGCVTRSVKATEIYVTSDPEAAHGSADDIRNWGTAAWSGNLSQATNKNDDPGCGLIEFGSKQARYVGFVFTSNYGDGGYCGLSEVRFFESYPEGAPEVTATSVARTADADTFTASASMGAAGGEVKALAYDGVSEDPVVTTLGTVAANGSGSAVLAGLQANTTYSVDFVAENEVLCVTNKSEIGIYTGTPTLQMKANGQEAGAVPGAFKVVRAAADPYPLTVNYTISSADGAAGVDYVAPTGTVVIPAGATEAEVEIVPLVNADKTSDTTVTIALAGGCYFLTGAVTASLTIENAAIPNDANYWIAGSASDGLASTASNWSKGMPTEGNEGSLVIGVSGNYSTKSMTWDATPENGLATTVTSWTQDAAYPGTVTFKTTYPSHASPFKTFTVTGDMTVNGGTITHPLSVNWDDNNSATLTLEELRAAYSYRLSLAANSFTLGAGARIDLSGKGHSWLRKTRNVKGCSPSHGGRYESTSIGCYGNPKYPEDIGLASNVGTDALSKCAVGGGAVKLNVTGSCVIDGEITVDGTKSSGSVAAGAAGSVLIEAARVTGSGVIHADGIYCGNSGQVSGAGGRIALLTTDPVDVSTLTVRAGGSGTGKYAPGGTVFLKDAEMTNGILFLNNPLNMSSSNATPNRGVFVTDEEGTDWTFDSIRMCGNVSLYVTEGKKLTLPNGFASVTAPDNTARVSGIYYRGGTLDVGTGDQTIAGPWYFFPSVRFSFPGDLTVSGGAAIGSCGYWEFTIANGAAPTSAWQVLFDVAGDMTLAADGAVTANTAGVGQQSGAQYEGIAIGAHGGRRSATGLTTDSVFTPHVAGVYQSNSYGYVKAGGAIDFTVNGCLTVDGSIVSDAPDTVDGGRGNACGGAINITAGSIAGAATGLISARGVRDVQCGGRIAVKLTDAQATFDDYAGAFAVNCGGSTSSSSAGSLYLKRGDEAEKAGVIIIDNANKTGVTTPICANGYEADEVADFKKARLLLRNKGLAQVTVADDSGEFRLGGVEIAENSKLDLYGHTLVVGSAKVNGRSLGPGTYTVASEGLADYLADSSTDGGGKLIVAGNGLTIVVR